MQLEEKINKKDAEAQVGYKGYEGVMDINLVGVGDLEGWMESSIVAMHFTWVCTVPAHACIVDSSICNQVPPVIHNQHQSSM